MTFGLPAYHEERVRYDCSGRDLMDAIDEALHRLKWSGSQTDRWRWRANTGISLWSWGENLDIVVEGPGELFVRSECSFPTQCFDWGRNRSNVMKFLDRIDKILERPRAERDEDY
jgi:hypothetical protein